MHVLHIPLPLTEIALGLLGFHLCHVRPPVPVLALVGSSKDGILQQFFVLLLINEPALFRTVDRKPVRLLLILQTLRPDVLGVQSCQRLVWDVEFAEGLPGVGIRVGDVVLEEEGVPEDTEGFRLREGAEVSLENLDSLLHHLGHDTKLQTSPQITLMILRAPNSQVIIMQSSPLNEQVDSLVGEINLLSQHYLKEVFPYESLCSAITLQHLQLQALQSEYQQLLQCEQVTLEESQRLQTYKASERLSTRVETKKWLSESILAQKYKFDGFYPRRKRELQEQIELKSMEHVSDLSGTNCLTCLEGSWEPVEWVLQSVKRGLIKEGEVEMLLDRLRTYDRMQPGEIGELIDKSVKQKDQKES